MEKICLGSQDSPFVVARPVLFLANPFRTQIRAVFVHCLLAFAGFTLCSTTTTTNRNLFQYKSNCIIMSPSTIGSVLLAPSPAAGGTQKYDLMYYLKGAAAGGICCSVTHGALTPVDGTQ